MANLFSYNLWRPIRWNTPVSDGFLTTPTVVGGDALDPLVILCIVSMGAQSPVEQCWNLSFDPPIAWMVRPETYTTGLCEDLNQYSRCADTGRPLGHTWIIPNSPWIDALCEDEPLIRDLNPVVQHYHIGGSNYIIDVASRVEPVFTSIQNARMESFVDGLESFLDAKDSAT